MKGTKNVLSDDYKTEVDELVRRKMGCAGQEKQTYLQHYRKRGKCSGVHAAKSS